MKKQNKYKEYSYKEYDNIIDEELLPAANVLSKLLKEVLGSTYPANILARRVNLLTKFEKSKCDKGWSKICKLFEDIDETISKRAEIESDPWKIIK